MSLRNPHVLLLNLTMVLLLAPLVGLAADEAEGLVPTAADGHKLNLDFESGTLVDWQAEGDAFAGQPIRGDTVQRRRRDMHSQHRGEYWIGGYERSGDKPQGTLNSAAFKVLQPYAGFLIGGGPHETTCVELVDHATGQVIFRASGLESEDLEPVIVDLRAHQGKEIVIRLVDKHTGGWGHINFDHFRLHATRPNFPKRATSIEDLYPYAGLSPEEAARMMVLPKGFKAQLFAGEPDVTQPIGFALDDRGRLWVAEAYSYPIRLPDEQAKDRILIFEDRDGDGHFDSRKVFAEKLNLVSGIEVGFGGVWVGAAPQFLFIPDRNGDDVPDGPAEVLLDGWGYQDTHETLNSFIWGPDGWLYGCHGVFTHSRVGKPGTPDEDRVPINAGIWRYHPTQHRFEVFAHGTSNPWGVDFNDHGQTFLTCCVIPHLFHVVQGARYHRQGGEHFNPFTYDDIKTIAKHRHWVGNQWQNVDRARSDSVGGGHAHAGAMIYLGAAWPEEYRGQLFMNNIHGARINQDQLAPSGSGYVGDAAPDFLLAQDRWSQIINLRYGPDGQVYMIDWYDQNQCHRREVDVHDRSNGRIFKVVYEGGEVRGRRSEVRGQKSEVRGQRSETEQSDRKSQISDQPSTLNPQPSTLDLKRLTDVELVELQLHANDWYVRHARRILQERGGNAEVHAGLAKIALGHADDTRRLRGLWALHVTGGLTEELALKAVEDASPYVRGWAIQLLLQDRAPSTAVLKRLSQLAKSDSSPVVRLYLASAADRLPLEQRWNLIASLCAHAEDAGDHNLPLMYWYAAEPLADVDPGRALELALRSRVPPLPMFMVRRVASSGTPETLAALVRVLDRMQQPAEQLSYLTGLLEALKGRRRLPMPEGWSAVFGRLESSAEPQVRTLATAIGLVFGDPQAATSMRRLLVDKSADVKSRGAALAALLQVRDAELGPTLHALIGDSGLRGAALRALAAYDHPRTPELVLARYSSFAADERRDALSTLASRVGYAEALLDAVARGQVASTDLSADLIRQLRNLKNNALRNRIDEVWGVVRNTAEDKARLIAEYQKLLTAAPSQAPDRSLGRAVFAKSCQQCHTLFEVGGNVGPELTGSNRANLDYLLSNVVDPSAVMVREYMPTIIETTDGRIITGIARNRDTTAITVTMPNESIILPRDEIASQQRAEKSMMPDDLLKPLSEHEVRSLVAYLASPAQVPLPEGSSAELSGGNAR
ncbi:MAG: c-type cytochrome [Planctomycetes bacterium]|nr:c-type cytochrome [Planctomycetota bacterium]